MKHLLIKYHQIYSMTFMRRKRKCQILDFYLSYVRLNQVEYATLEALLGF